MAAPSGLNMAMLDDTQLEDAVKDLLLDICEVMYRKGYDYVSVGAMMRLVGVPAERAGKHDSEYFQLDDDFRAMLTNRKSSARNKNNKKIPSVAAGNVTIH